MIRTLHHDRWFRVDLEPRDGLYRIARTTEGFADLATCEAAHRAVESAVAEVPAGAKLMLDVRDAPPRNDPQFERIVGESRDRMFARFARVAILVRTAAGLLHVKRLNQHAGAHVRVFDDEDRAFEWLLGD